MMLVFLALLSPPITLRLIPPINQLDLLRSLKGKTGFRFELTSFHRDIFEKNITTDSVK